jgi:RNA-directed DNA polymerase
MKMLYTRWKDVDWASVQAKVFKWQQEIYSASKLGDKKLVRKYQHRLMGSFESKILAVRRITQDNRGEIIGGIDNVETVPAEKRLTLALSLEIPGGALPIYTVGFSKSGKPLKKRLVVPTLEDRCLQFLFKMALEPEWEAQFEHNSYGFRPGRNCHDAISAVRGFVQKRSKYVLDAELAKCFANINQEKLLDKIGMMGKFRKQLKMWLRRRVLDEFVFSETERYDPEIRVISPLLANIALHGIEDFCKNLIQHTPVYGSTGVLVKPSRRRETLGFVRYADNFVLIHPQLSIITLIQEKLPDFLAQLGLEINNSKTRITHTLEIPDVTREICTGLCGKPGFNFLGFYIRQYKTVHSSALSANKQLLGFKTVIVPSRKKRNAHQAILHDLILRYGKRTAQDELIKRVNHVVFEWANYFGKSDANTTHILGQMDYLLYLKVRKWAKRVYRTTGKGRKAFRRIGNRKCNFATDKCVLIRHIDYSNPLSKYIKVRGDSSPFDLNQVYWSSRLSSNTTHSTRISILLRKQKGCCTWCKAQFKYDDILEVDHIIPYLKDGKDEFNNLQLLHGHCHDIKTNFDTFDL